MKHPSQPPAVSAGREPDPVNRYQPVLFGENCQICNEKKNVSHFFVRLEFLGEFHLWRKKICEDCSRSVHDRLRTALPGIELVRMAVGHVPNLPPVGYVCRTLEGKWRIEQGPLDKEFETAQEAADSLLNSLDR